MTATTGMVLAAGLGTRMRPITEHTPKPLVEVGGRSLLDRAIDQLVQAGVRTIVVNVHYLAEQIEQHLSGRGDAEFNISDERDMLLDTGGGIAKALGVLGPDPFYVSNGDSLWFDGPEPLLEALNLHWRDAEMDCLLALASKDSLGYDGAGDFTCDCSGRLRRATSGESEALVNTGIYLVHPRLFAKAPQEPFSMNLLWDRATEAGRLFGQVVEGTWMHIGTPEALDEANSLLKRS